MFDFLPITERNLLEIDAKHHKCLTEDIDDPLKIPVVVDQMDNNFSLLFCAHPDRIIFIREGRVAYLGNTIMKQVSDPSRLMTHEARAWLEANIGRSERA